MSAEAILQRYRGGAISAEIALMQLLASLGSLAALDHRLAAPDCGGLAEAARLHRDGLSRTATLIESGLAEGRNGVAAIRAQFDCAVTLAPEASVALYSLGSPEILARATEEIVAVLREWGLITPDCRVLDIGCGIGRLETALAPHVATITGTDLSPNMIAEAKRRCADLPNAQFICTGGLDLSDFGDGACDLALAVDSFPYLVAADPAIADTHVAEAARVLADRGALAIFNYSYRGDLAADRAAVADHAARHGFTVERNGTCDFTLWDAATFLLRKPGLLRKPA